jgi:cystathionine beta-lyase/cystathionine gamma-synthase
MNFETLAIHAGQEPDPNNGAVMTPVYLTSTYMQDGVGKPRQGYEYSRTMNPTRKALQDCLAALELPRLDRGLEHRREIFFLLAHVALPETFII